MAWLWLAPRTSIGCLGYRQLIRSIRHITQQTLRDRIEMTSLSQHCDRILDPGTPPLSYEVVGDTGTGKTVLLEKLAERCRDDGLLVLSIETPRFNHAKDPDLAAIDACLALISEFRTSIDDFQRQHPESEASVTAAKDALGRARNPAFWHHLVSNSTAKINVTHAEESVIIGGVNIYNGQMIELSLLLSILQQQTEEALRGLADEYTLAVLVDDVDRLDGTSVQEWLRTLLRKIRTRHTVTARRSAGGFGNRGRTAADRTIRLQNMTPEEVGAYLEEQGLVFAEEDAHGLFELTDGHGFAVAAWCDIALNGGAARLTDLLELVRGGQYDEDFTKLIESIQGAVDQIAADVLGYQVPLFGLLTIAERVTPGLITMLEGDGRRPSQDEADKIYQLLVPRGFLTVVDRRVEEGASLPRAISEVARPRLLRDDPVEFQALHSWAELYERQRVDLDRELKPRELEQEPFAAWTRFEQITWIQGVERWMGHTQWLNSSQFQEMRPALVKMYLDAFWWWDDYLRSKATSDLGTSLKQVSVRQRDDPWMSALEKFSDHWVSSWDEAELRSDASPWYSVLDSITALLNMFGLEYNRVPSDMTLRRIYILLCNFYGKALWYSGDATREDAEKADCWLAAAFRACQKQPGEEDRSNPNGWIGSWALLRRAEIWATLDPEQAIGYLTGLDQTAIDDEDDDLRVGVAMAIGDLWWQRGDYARALDTYARGILFSYAYNGKQEKRRKAPNLYTKSLYASTIRRAEEKIAQTVRDEDSKAIAEIDTALAAVRDLFGEYWNRLERPDRRATRPPEPSRFELPVPPPWPGDILKIDSQYYSDIEAVVQHRASVIEEPIDPPSSDSADGTDEEESH